MMGVTVPVGYGSVYGDGYGYGDGYANGDGDGYGYATVVRSDRKRRS